MFTSAFAGSVVTCVVSACFNVDTKVVIAVEGGPVIVQAAVTYTGPWDLLVNDRSYDSPCDAVPPSQW
jgi:hypothetical protein